MKGVLACPLCGGNSERAFTVGDRNRATSEERFDYRRCTSCGTLFLGEVPADLAAHYPDSYHVQPAREQLDQAACGELSKLELLRPFISGGRLIEVGAGVGIFAHAALQGGFDVTAIEMDAQCCAYLETVVGVRAIRSSAPERALVGLGPASAIVLWHVLEHLPRPWDVLARAADELEPGGIIALATPNPESVQFRLLGARWAHVDAPRHLFLIPFDALGHRAAALGLDVGMVTTTDAAGRYWNMFGWEYAIRRHPADRPSTRVTRVAARALALGLAPWERRRMSGTAYTAVLVKR